MLMKHITQIAIILLIIIIGLVIGAAISIFASPELEQARFCPSGYKHVEECHYPDWLTIIIFTPILITPLLLLWVYNLKRKR